MMLEDPNQMLARRKRPRKEIKHTLSSPANSNARRRTKSSFQLERTTILIGSLLCIAGIIILFLILRKPFEQDSLLERPASDDGDGLSRMSLASIGSVENDDIARDFIGCMPTVQRAEGTVEYVGNAVKSWGLATNGGRKVGKLIVFDMNVNVTNFDVKGILGGNSGGWWEVKRRENRMRDPRMFTHGDSVERARWRSKEALDYAEVLSRCVVEAQKMGIEFVLLVQDDVLFKDGFDEARLRVGEVDAEREGKWCSISLFDIGSTRNGQKQDTSNMVARVFKAEKVGRLARYIRSKFDQSPVDWLADDYCRSWGLSTFVVVPNLVRHRGKVSSFKENKREGLLT